MAGNNNGVKINLRGGHHRVMVHHIAKLAFFSNRLPGLVFRGITNFSWVFYNVMLVCIHHVLACNKANKQYPRINDMIFGLFQTFEQYTMGKSN